MIKVAKLSRNDKCLCGSNIKYKKCCSTKEEEFYIIEEDSFSELEKRVLEIEKTVTEPKDINNINIVKEIRKVTNDMRKKFCKENNIIQKRAIEYFSFTYVIQGNLNSLDLKPCTTECNLRNAIDLELDYMKKIFV